MKSSPDKSIQPPQLPKHLHPETIENIQDHAEYSAVSVLAADFTRQVAANIVFEHVHFQRVIFNQTLFTKLRVVDMGRSLIRRRRSKLPDCWVSPSRKRVNLWIHSFRTPKVCSAAGQVSGLTFRQMRVSLKSLVRDLRPHAGFRPSGAVEQPAVLPPCVARHT